MKTKAETKIKIKTETKAKPIRPLLPKVSTTVSKLGTSIPCINLPAGLTCRENPPCKSRCYANKGNFIFKNVKKSLMNNLEAYTNSPENYFSYIELFLKGSQYKYFRYHSSGDIVDDEYFERMCNLAFKTEDIKYLCFTKKYETVNSYINTGGKLSNNLTIVFSNWGSFECFNPYNLPVSYVNLAKEDCVIPPTAKACSGYCGACASTENSCWNLKKGESVVFKQH